MQRGWRVLAIVLLSSLPFGVTLAQDGSASDGYAISATTGTFVLGGRTAGDAAKLEVAQTLETQNAMVELEVGNRSHLRLRQESVVSLSRSPYNHVLTLEEGAVLAVFRSRPSGVSVVCGSAPVTFARKGEYRIDRASDGTCYLRVLKGVAHATVEGTEIEVHDSRVLRLQAGSRPKKDRKAKDELTMWSEQRHAELR